METIMTIWEKLQFYKDFKPESKEEFNWQPVKCEDYIVPEFILPDTRKKEPQKVLLSKVLAFIDLNKQRRYSDCCTIMPIPVTNKKLVSICGNFKEVSRLIQFMIQIGLISLDSSDYSFGHKDNNYCKTYKYYVENEKLIKEYCNNNNINIYTWKNYKERNNNNNNNNNNTLVDTFRITSFEPSEVKFSNKVHLLKPDNYSVSQFEDYLLNLLYINYPQLAHYQQLADEINDTYYKDYPELQIQFIPTFTWNKGYKSIRKIGIRATNSLVSAKKEYKEGYKGNYREDILNKYGFHLRKDVKSSVPRITTSINYGYWIPESIDIYEEIYKVYNKLYNNTLVDTFTESKDIYKEIYKVNNKLYNNTLVDTFAEIRPIIKDLHMSGYFDGENTLGRNIFHRMYADGEYEEVKRLMLQFKYAVIEAEGGETFSNEVFFHESCIYMDVLKHLLDDGFFVWEVYDEWFAKKDDWVQEEYEQYVTDLVEDIANKYIMSL